MNNMNINPYNNDENFILQLIDNYLNNYKNNCNIDGKNLAFSEELKSLNCLIYRTYKSDAINIYNEIKQRVLKFEKKFPDYEYSGNINPLYKNTVAIMCYKQIMLSFELDNKLYSIDDISKQITKNIGAYDINYYKGMANNITYKKLDYYYFNIILYIYDYVKNNRQHSEITIMYNYIKSEHNKSINNINNVISYFNSQKIDIDKQKLENKLKKKQEAIKDAEYEKRRIESIKKESERREGLGTIGRLQEDTQSQFNRSSNDINRLKENFSKNVDNFIKESPKNMEKFGQNIQNDGTNIYKNFIENPTKDLINMPGKLVANASNTSGDVMNVLKGAQNNFINAANDTKTRFNALESLSQSVNKSIFGLNSQQKASNAAYRRTDDWRWKNDVSGGGGMFGFNSSKNVNSSGNKIPRFINIVNNIANLVFIFKFNIHQLFGNKKIEYELNHTQNYYNNLIHILYLKCIFELLNTYIDQLYSLSTSRGGRITKKVVKTTPKKVVKTAPKKVVKTAPKKVVKTVPKKVVKTVLKKVVKTAPKKVVKTGPKKVVKTAPKKVVKTAPKKVVKTAPKKVVKTAHKKVVKTTHKKNNKNLMV